MRAGVVTDRSIELLWDGAEGGGHHYEALCMNCAETVMVRSCVRVHILCMMSVFLLLHSINDNI